MNNIVTTTMKGRNLVSGNIIVPTKVSESETTTAIVSFGLIGAFAYNRLQYLLNRNLI